MEEEENQEVLKTDAEIVLIFNRKKLYATKYVVIRQIKRCLFRQIKTGLSEHLTMG